MKKEVYKLVCGGMCLALCLILPFLTMQIPEIGQLLSPMHLPVFLCGFVCGWKYGLLVGFTAPLLRSLLFGMPPLFPTAASMAVELAVYGIMSAVLYARLPKKTISLYTALIGAMIVGRVAGGAFQIFLLGFGYLDEFTLGMFVSSYFVQTLPGIICHILLVPPLVLVLRKMERIFPVKIS